MKKFVGTLITSTLFTPLLSFAYDAPTTHAGLSQEIVSFYNYSHTAKISESKKEKIIQGSIDEDYNPQLRVFNHFYDPVQKIGIEGYATSKAWASGSELWNVFSWKQGIEAYAKGDVDNAYIILGHVIHLIEDAGVPDHTRNDPHPPAINFEKSPYEYWTSLHKDRETLAGLGYSLYAEGNKIRNFESLGEYFDFLAKYSNENFYSKDTITQPIPIYSKPKVKEVLGKYTYGIDSISENKVKFYILQQESDGSYSKILGNDKDTSVLSEYFDRLSRQIIPTGAGVISLFIKEGEAAKKEYEKNKSEEEVLAEQERVKKEVAEEKLATAGFFSKPKYWIQYTWEYDVKQGAWTSVGRVRESVSEGLASIFQGVKNIGSMFSFGTKEGFKEAVVSSNSVSFTQKRNSNAVGPIFAFIKESKPISETIFYTSNEVPELQPVFNAQTIPLPTAPITIVPGFGGGGGGGSEAPSLVLKETPALVVAEERVIDTTPPDITVTLPQCAYSLWSEGCALSVATTSLVWTTNAADISRFGVFVDGAFLGEGSSTDAELALIPGAHRIQVVATDEAGNSATSTELALTILTKPLVISEIAWAGTGVSPNNQWVELYNNTEKEINLSQIKISKEGGGFDIPLSGTIGAHSYYLVGRDSDEVVPSVTADLVASFGSGLSILGEELKLLDIMGEQETVLDKTPAVSLCEGWCEGSDASLGTMARVNLMGNGSGSANWATDAHYSRSIFDATGVTIQGSPKGPIENPCLLPGLAGLRMSHLAAIRVDPCL